MVVGRRRAAMHVRICPEPHDEVADHGGRRGHRVIDRAGRGGDHGHAPLRERIEQVSCLHRMEGVDAVACGDVAARPSVSRSMSASESRSGTPSALARAAPTVVLPLPISPTRTMCATGPVCVATAGTARGARPAGHRAWPRVAVPTTTPTPRSRPSTRGRIDVRSRPAAAHARRIAGSQLASSVAIPSIAVRRHDRGEDLDATARCDECRRTRPARPRPGPARHAAANPTETQR